MEKFDFPCSPAFRRLYEFGHKPNCTCERCWIRIERALQHYVPGLLPESDRDRRFVQLEEEVRMLREEKQQWLEGKERFVSQRPSLHVDSAVQILCQVPE